MELASAGQLQFGPPTDKLADTAVAGPEPRQCRGYRRNPEIPHFCWQKDDKWLNRK